MAIAAEPLVEEKNAPTQRPDRDGRFGRFGGKYVSCPDLTHNDLFNVFHSAVHV